MKSALRVALIIAGVLLVSAVVGRLAWYRMRPAAANLPVIGRVPDFSLIDSSGRPFSQAQLAGTVWVADFIYTHCPGVCPLLTAQMAKLQGALVDEGAQRVRLVSFTVDPTNDTPEVLREYGKRFGAQPERWFFLTGERAALYSLIAEGFHLAVAERPESENRDGEGLITHSDRFVLVDRRLQIRGYYHGNEQESVQKLRQDIDLLIKEGAS